MDYESQPAHIAYTPLAEDLPPAEIIEARRIDALPARAPLDREQSSSASSSSAVALASCEHACSRLLAIPLGTQSNPRPCDNVSPPR